MLFCFRFVHILMQPFVSASLFIVVLVVLLDIVVPFTVLYSALVNSGCFRMCFINNLT